MKNFVLYSSFFVFLISPVHADINPLLQSSSRYDHVQVERVISPDTIIVNGDKKISLIGIKAPRPPKNEDPPKDKHGLIIRTEGPAGIPVEENAFRFASRLLQGKYVRLEFDAQRLGPDNVLQAYVFLDDGTMANLRILRQGYAELRIRPPNLRYVREFREAYREARQEMRGLMADQ
jgi:micrococcal nuclease